MVVRKATQGEGGGDVVVAVDRYDGNVKRQNHWCQRVASEQDHVHRKVAKPVPVGSLHLAHHHFQIQSQICACYRLPGSYYLYHCPGDVDPEI